MGKTKNIKRAKMLRQRKKEREKENSSTTAMSADSRTLARSKMKERLENVYNTEVEFSYRSKSAGRKISDVLSEMIKPLMDKTTTFEEEQNLVGLGVVAWNLGVIKKKHGEKEMRKTLKGFGRRFPKSVKPLLLYYVEVKCNKYGEYNEVIVDYDYSSLNDYENNLTVSYEIVKD